jgi:hypothetical protein
MSAHDLPRIDLEINVIERLHTWKGLGYAFNA